MKYLLSFIAAIGLMACWIGAAINIYWVAIYCIESIRGTRPLDWGFIFVFSLELIVIGGVAVALASFAAVASATKLPAILSPRSISRLFGGGVLLFVLSLLVQSFFAARVSN